MLPGVYKTAKKDGTVYYKAGITYKNKHISLGSFTTERAANAAYEEAGRILGSKKRKFESLLRKKTHLLPFEKAVILYNFRDNGIYIKNPIYMRKKTFSYFLSPTYELKFDADDLFYYSMHRIIQRQGRLFVNDYGMQMGILTRYGIQPYSVEGRDYEYKNGDRTDLRYENIVVKNPFRGVRIIHGEVNVQYKALMHINGDWVLGTYDHIHEAAIAYNKALDIMADAGIAGAREPNYIDELSPKAYADIYSGAEISAKFISYVAEMGI